MLNRFFTFIAASFLLVNSAASQTTTNTKTLRIGTPFSISLPDYMSRTVGLNSAANFQYKNEEKDVYGFVIEDDKEELKLAELSFASVDEFYKDFIEVFLTDAEKKNIGTPAVQKKNGISYLECDVSYFDKDAGAEIYYLVGIVETNSAFYKILSWTTLENKNTYKADFRNILYSFKN